MVKSPELTVGILLAYDYPNLYRQTPSQAGIWKNVRFLVNDTSEPCDVLVVLNRFYEKVKVRCGDVWLVIQEPPDFPGILEGHSAFNRVYSPLCPDSSDSRCTPSHGALPWHVDMSYDELKSVAQMDKNKSLSWITTSKEIFPGHKVRMDFLRRLKASDVDFDLYGRGFAVLGNKYDGLAPYRYSLAIENYSCPNYWTEKVADCFLSWTMPIYYGCTNLADYFPEEAFFQIDINDADVFDKIGDVVRSDLHMKRRDAIAEARRLVLDEYQLFPFIASRLENGSFSISNRKFYPYGESPREKVLKNLRKLVCW